MEDEGGAHGDTMVVVIMIVLMVSILMVSSWWRFRGGGHSWTLLVL